MDSSRTGHENRSGLVRRWVAGVGYDLECVWSELVGLWRIQLGWVARLARLLGHSLGSTWARMVQANEHEQGKA